ncbi:MAG TPA: hypothetical protein VGW78_00330 [Candidatus Babeliales bacterium]|jgi:predicted Zn-dependent protease|nr:hypothetical protein [Candidatus Babeliales bacterium]
MGQKNNKWASIVYVILVFGMQIAIGGDYSNVLHQTMWATFLHYDKQYSNAQDWFVALLEQPMSLYALKGYFLFLFDRQDYASLLEYVPVIEKKLKNDVDMQRVAAHTLLHTGHTQEADALFIKLNRQFPTNADIALETVKSLLKVGNIEQALEVTHTIINKTLQKQAIFLFFFIQAQLYIKKNDMNKAREVLKQCLNMRPNFAQGWLLSCLIELQEGNKEKAMLEYVSYLQIAGVRNMQVEQYFMAQTSNQIIKPQLHKQMPLYTKAVLLYKSKQYASALSLLARGIMQEPNNVQYKLLTLQILIDMKNPTGALTLLVSWIYKDPESQLWFTLMHLLSDVYIPAEEIKGTLESLKHTLGPNIWLHLYLADIYMRKQEYYDAYICLNQAVLVCQDAAIKTELYFMLALIGYETGDMYEVQKAVEQGIAQHIVHAPLYNLAAYYYATKGNTIQKASYYIEQALVQDPHNIHYLDTQGVVWYKKQEYAKAEVLFDTLHTQIPHDSTITLHAAKTKYKLEKKEEAYILMDEARGCASHLHEQHTIARLKQKWHQAL